MRRSDWVVHSFAVQRFGRGFVKMKIFDRGLVCDG